MHNSAKVYNALSSGDIFIVCKNMLNANWEDNIHVRGYYIEKELVSTSPAANTQKWGITGII